ncbi:rho GTPase-activating protein 18-like isoform X2 [Betta splendens]|uniref:Rho GTPase-activating protein 18-like isoform X2 n=1 Tax=Betta splendens TaxID=158456 RepID=A0A9W2XPS2_BETSP|nr:rho GTPase-activating protein 18-like isoform X2 [Betta splendens]
MLVFSYCSKLGTSQPPVDPPSSSPSSRSSQKIGSRTYRRMLSSPPTTDSSTLPPNPHTVISDPRHVALETYWREVHSIEEQEGEQEEEEEEEMKSLDEVEMEEAWLTEAGLSSLVNSSLEAEELPLPAEVLVSTLTRQQVATVKRRLDNYNETLRKRNRQPIRDVRDIFTQHVDEAGDRCQSPPCHLSEPAPSRYHASTKTIRRHTHRARPTLPTFLFEDQLPEHSSSPTSALSPAFPSSPPHSHLPPISRARRADWLLRECSYSEGVAEHKRGGACWDCFHGDDNSDLPFLPAPHPQGLTCADDLSSCDLTRLGFISHIELSTFLLTLGVQAKRSRPPRRRTRDSGVFGLSLDTLLKHDRKKFPEIKVPLIFQKLIFVLEQTGLQTEGILRIPGSAVRLKYLRREVDRCGAGFDWSAVRQVEAAGLLKLFIRELPTPLLTHTHLSTYRAVLGIQSVVHQVQALQLLSLLLPEAHRNTLRALLSFLRKVVCHQDQNRMSLWNVSMVMAPNLFACCHQSNKHSVAQQREEMEEAVGGAHLIQLMITHQDLLWTVRQVNKVSNQRQFGPQKTKKQPARRKIDRNQVTDLYDGVIRVHAPLHSKVSMAIQLDGQTRARDVTAHFQSEKSPVPSLYEVGGNICERRLHPDCVLLDVYRVNPHCDWLIKP